MKPRPPKKPPPLTPAQVAQIVRDTLESPGTISPSRHFRQRAQERDFTMQDAFFVLERGAVARTPEWNERTGTWNYDVRGTDIEGEPLTIRIAVVGERAIVLVTGY